ncbi:hypothetical protein M441DRAFT_31171 [Trichoderma asperellum CBS 433.97]|uniref:Apopolysialoglycoprotein n=1 Tax=Trichoderma asperellum (strain ATCC 204424 / CBS 433.97 / NBRC 101777) TaxID=1042311 RepID=A0A2T3YVI7_TRIA4|nr:hypothetical protein M441DRAFT_31171 [Trichoderma asperellum CBS 433.97]PTB36588.1 hypothetical protein M441DRAFT_31171 [Trichoderma asperellum CBS 433.97]
MAPGTRRAGRSGYAEHDDFEGLPVRQWRHEWVNVAPPVQQEQQQQNDIWAIELIHGMPKDATLLPPHTQELLRAARSGRLYKRPLPNEDEEADNEANMQDKLEKKEEDTSAQGYQIRVWKQLPKNVEAPVISHLAKRRKNTVTTASRTIEEKVQGPTVTRATVRRMDAAGNPYTEEVTLSEGQRVDGEVISTRVESMPAAQPDTYAAVPQAAARRRPPPPKRKAKAGPGRGKKKSKQQPSADAQAARSVPAAAGVTAAVKTESNGGVTLVQNENVPPNPDSEMGDGEGDGDEEEEDDEEGDDGDDGDEGEDGEEGEGEGEGDETDDVKPQDESVLDASKDHDEEMVDASHIIDNPDTEMQDEQPAPEEPAPRESSPPKPANPTLELPPENPLSLPIKHEDTPPRNAVIVPSPSAPSVNTESEAAIAQPVLDTPADNTADSTIAEPPSTIVGEAPREAIERDIPHVEGAVEGAVGEVVEETALPPPDQVGNISSPKAEYESSRELDEASKGQTSVQPDDRPQKPILMHQLSTMTEDTIKPEDSVSVTAPMPESEAPSETGNASVEDGKEEALPASTEAESTEPQLAASEAGDDAPAAKEDEPDLLGGLMGELDRQAAASQLLEEVVKPNTTSAAEAKAESPVDTTLPDVPEPEVEADPEPKPEPEPEPEVEPEAETAPTITEEEATNDIPQPETLPEPEQISKPEEESNPVPESNLVPESNPVPESKPEPEVESKPEPEPELKPEPEPAPELEPETAPEDQPMADVTPPVKSEPPAEEGEGEKADPPADA